MKYRMKDIFLTMLFCVATLGIISCGEKFNVPAGPYDDSTDTLYIEETDGTNNGATISDPDNTDNTETLNNDSTDTLEDQQKTEDNEQDQYETDNEKPADADDQIIADNDPADETSDQKDEDEKPDESDQPAYDCLYLNLVATKSYKPPTRFDAEETLDRIIQFEIPTEIPVTKGNAGNHLSKFYFTDPTDNKEVTCTYKGGVNKSHPKDSVQIEKGLYYEFKECDNDMIAGETTLSNYFRLEIVNGDSKAGETEISLTLDELPGECAD